MNTDSCVGAAVMASRHCAWLLSLPRSCWSALPTASCERAAKRAADADTGDGDAGVDRPGRSQTPKTEAAEAPAPQPAATDQHAARRRRTPMPKPPTSRGRRDERRTPAATRRRRPSARPRLPQPANPRPIIYGC